MLQQHCTSLPVVNYNDDLVGVVQILDILGKTGAVGLYVKALGGYVQPDPALNDAWEIMSRENPT